MKNFLKQGLKLPLSGLANLWYRRFLHESPKVISLRSLLIYGFYQRVLGYNKEVYWPVHRTSTVTSVSKIVRGTRCPGLSKGVHLDGRNGIRFGSNVWIGPYVAIISQNHDSTNYRDYIDCDPIVIGDNCWIGAHAIVLPGVQLGNHVIIGAGSVVTKSFQEDNILLAGNPAIIKKKLGTYLG